MEIRIGARFCTLKLGERIEYNGKEWRLYGQDKLAKGSKVIEPKYLALIDFTKLDKVVGDHSVSYWNLGYRLTEDDLL